MYNARNSNERKASGRRTVRLSKSRLEALVEEATIDAYNEAEQAAGFFTMLLDALLVSIEQLGPNGSEGLFPAFRAPRTSSALSILDPRRGSIR